MPMIVSIGEPKRNKDYHSAVSPKRASDNTESLAMARFAVVEKPVPTRPIPPAFVVLREIASRLQGAVKDSTRAINRFHNLVSRVFPELAMIVADLDACSILDLLEKYPSPHRIANANLASLCKISYHRKNVAEAIRIAAKNTVASVSGSAAESLVTEQIVNIRNCEIAEKKLLHLVFAVWSTDRPFDPEYEEKRTAAKRAEAKRVQESQPVAESPGAATSDVVEFECGTIVKSIAPLAETLRETTVETEATAGHNQALSLENKEVTAAASRSEPVMRSSGIAGSSLPHVPSESTVDFSFVREQIGFDPVLSHLGLRDTFRGQTQLRGACPLCQSAGTLSVNLRKNLYRCFHSGCSQGNILDFWSALKGAPLLAAAHDLAHTFGLETQRIQPPQPHKTPPKENPKKSGVITPDAT